MTDNITFAKLFESSFDAIIIVDEEGTIKRANHQIYEIFGYNKNEIEGNELKHLIPHKYRKIHLNHFNGYLKNPMRMVMSEHSELYGLRKDGSLFPIEVILSPLNLKEKQLTLASIRDISKRKQFEKELKNKELQYKNLILNHPHGIIETSFDGTIIIVNKAYAELYGLEVEYLVGKKAWEVTEDKELKREIIEFYRKSKDGQLEPETSIEERKTVDGKIKKIQIDWDYRVDSSGNKTGLTIVVTDVTKFKDIEKDLLVAQNRLRAISKNVQNKIEEERKKIAREIHDELGQVLTAINMELDLIIVDLEESNDSYAQKIIENLGSLGKLIDSLIITVQNISTELRPDVLDFLGLYEAIKWQLKEFETRFKINSKINNFTETINLSEEKIIGIYRILQETLTNIARHSKATDVIVNFEMIEDDLVIRITDNGIGIDKHVLNDINSLGILGIKERVHILGGEVSFNIVNEGGTEVYLKVPLK